MLKKLLLIAVVSLVWAEKPIAIVIHGGAGVITKENMTPELEKAFKQKMTEAIKAGYKKLKAGGSSIEAVEITIRILEDSPLFNAGRGAVFAADGTNQMDASIMDGRDKDAGAIAGVSGIRHPISLARLVKDKSKHVMLSGQGAVEFALSQGLKKTPAKFFFTERRWQQLKKAQGAKKHGTVGCVALDVNGNLAAGTSTGGMTNKQYGRIGDSPVIGAGTYAENGVAAVSCTGHGEYFIRANVAYDVIARMKYLKEDVAQSAGTVIHTSVTGLGGTGGLIALDAKGNFAMPFNTPGMFRASIDISGDLKLAIYLDK